MASLYQTHCCVCGQLVDVSSPHDPAIPWFHEHIHNNARCPGSMMSVMKLDRQKIQLKDTEQSVQHHS